MREKNETISTIYQSRSDSSMSQQTPIDAPMRMPEQLITEWRERETFTPGDLYTEGRAFAFERCADELELALKAHCSPLSDRREIGIVERMTNDGSIGTGPDRNALPDERPNPIFVKSDTYPMQLAEGKWEEWKAAAYEWKAERDAMLTALNEIARHCRPNLRDEINKSRKAIQMIRDDMANDAKEFDGKPFNGRTVAEYLGNLGAAIDALAAVVDLLLAEK